ncbi:MAG TPA: patatin-like phospholipase family protein [Candidatus Cybelea sp.]|jgi:predicted acylesterase/phospholipase RssA
MIDRRGFLLAAGASAVSPLLFGATEEERAPVRPLNRALVFSGGGARGAYQAGIVGELVAAAGVSDGEPLPPYDVVCGTSIGALNGWCVASAQYSKLRELWFGISSENVIVAKPQYEALRDPNSGVLNIAASVVSLTGLIRNQRAVLQSKPAYDWISRHVDPTAPLVAPLIWAVTNLTYQRPEYFYVLPQGKADLPVRVTHALRVLLGNNAIVRAATPDILHSAIFASIAIPIAFDPISMRGPDGTMDLYCDGGVASNSPVGIGHAVAKAADVVLLDPPFEPEESYDDAVEIAFATYGTMQRKIFGMEMRSAYFESLGRREYAGLSPGQRLTATQRNADLESYIENVPATDLRYIRPQKVLPVSVVGFNDSKGIYGAYRAGWEDIAAGFRPYDWRTFEQ